MRERRSLLGLTQAELARRAGCAPITVRKMEGDALRPSVQLAELLALALQLPEGEQANFVRLARHEKPITPIPRPTPSAAEIGLEDLTGRAVKGFQLAELIGSGGFGVVYRAVQSSVQRDVAVKIILPRFANHPTFIRRFEAEAHLVARLEHPHIVPLYDYWREPNAAYLIMRLLRAGSLDKLLQQGPLELNLFRQIVFQVGRALAVAHANNVVHRDIKPANILLDDAQNAYLGDFGIAKILDLVGDGAMTEAGALIGSPAYISPEQIQNEPIRPSSDIYCFGLLLFEMLTGRKAFPGPTPLAYLQQHLNEPTPSLLEIMPNLPPAIDTILQRASAKEPAARFPSMEALLDSLNQVLVQSTLDISSLHLVGGTAVPDLSAQEISALENPYRGLRAFTESDADNFFGRATLVQELLSLMSDGSDLERFLAVVGPSGSGKSSLVKAGLLPALRRGGLPGSENWFIVDLTPGGQPWAELAAALRRVAVNPLNDLEAQLQADHRGLLRAVHVCLPDDGETELLLVIDQFEELFTLVEEETVREGFLQGLVTAVLDPGSRVRIVMTLRADFTDRPLQYVDFGELMEQRMSLVLPLTPDELTQAVTGPVERLGMIMSPELVSTIIQDVGNQPGMLPLLQYALTELFEQRQGRALTLGNYRQTGGVAGALARRADEIFAQLDSVGQEATRQLFLRLITLGEGTEDTRRRVLLAELEALPIVRQSSTDNRLPIVEYGKYRLLTFDHDPVTRGSTVEVAHEAMLREWPLLRSWLQDSREDVRRQRLLAQAAAQWEHNDRDESYLLRGSRLTSFVAWAETTRVALTDDDRYFLQISTAARDERRTAEEARRQRELDTARQLAREQGQRAEEQALAAQSLRQRALFLTGALLVAAILAIIAFSFANSSNSNANLAATREAEALAAQSTAEAETVIRGTAEAEAIQERNVAEEQVRLTFSRELASAAINNLTIDPELSMLLAWEALRIAYTNTAEIALRQALQSSRSIFRLEADEVGSFPYTVVDPGGQFAASGAQDQVLIWRVATGERLADLSLDNRTQVDFVPDGSLLAIAHKNGAVTFHYSENGDVAYTLQLSQESLSTVAISPDGSLLAAANDMGQLFVWDLVSRRELYQVQVSDEDRGILWTDFGPDGTWIGTLDDAFQFILWNSDSGTEEYRLERLDDLGALAISPDGARLFVTKSSSSGNDLHVWNLLDTAVSPNEPESIYIGLHSNSITDISFSPDGSRFATVSLDSSVKIWDSLAINSGPLLTLSGQIGGLGSVMFTADGQSVISGGADGIRVWDVSAEGVGEVQSFMGNDLYINSVAYSPDGSSIASAGADGFIHIRDVATGKLRQTLVGHESDTVFVTYSPDGSTLASTSTDGTVRLWDAESGEVLHVLLGHGEGIVGGFFEGVLTVSFNFDGSLLASAGADGTVRIWDTITGEQVYQFMPHPDGYGVTNVQFSPNGEQIAAVTDFSPRLVIWDLSEEAIIHVNDAFDSPRIWGLDYSPDGRLIALGESGGRLSLYDASTGEMAFELPGHSSTIGWGALDFSPDGSLLLTGSTDGAIKVWNIERQALFSELPIVPGSVDGAVFSPDGKHIAVGGNELIVRIYTLDLGELLAITDARLTRTLTDDECRQYLHLDACTNE